MVLTTNNDLETQICDLKSNLQQVQEQSSHAENAPSEERSNEKYVEN